MDNTIFFVILAIISFSLLYRAISRSDLGLDKTTNQGLPDKIRFVDGKDGKVIEMKLIQPKQAQNEVVFNDETFLAGAKLAFQTVSTAFAKGAKSDLKNYLTPDVYKLFESVINQREAQKQTMDFSLVCIDSAKIIQKSNDQSEITVQFISEQVNLLKDESGQVLEGDPMSISKIADIWKFKRKGKTKWVVSATKSGEFYA